MFFWWTNQMHPGLLIFFFVAFAFVLYSFTSAVRGFNRETDPTQRPCRSGEPADPGWRCREPHCRGDNPSFARYCRRCGSPRR